MPKLNQSVQGERLPRDHQRVMAQVGWIGQTGEVYELYDQPFDEREPGGFSPLYMAIGVWEHLGDGRYGIKD